MLLTLLVLGVALMLWLGKFRRGGDTARGSAAPPPAPAPQAMVACARCGVHLPRAEVFLDDRGQPFCGAEHRRLGALGPRR